MENALRDIEEIGIYKGFVVKHEVSVRKKKYNSSLGQIVVYNRLGNLFDRFIITAATGKEGALRRAKSFIDYWVDYASKETTSTAL